MSNHEREHDHSHGHAHGHSHSHNHASAHAGTTHRWRLQVAFVLTALFFVAELSVGIWSGALTLIGDAGHMAVDVLGLAVALFATRMATKTDKTGRRTYGYYRIEIFSAGLSVILMLGVAAYVLIEAVMRYGHPHSLTAGPMMLVGVLGLVINVISLSLLMGGAGESLNIKGAYLEVLADALGSIGIIVSAGLIMLTKHTIWDSIVAALLAIFIAYRAIRLGKEVIDVLGQSAPEGIDPHEASEKLASLPGVTEVHDLHLWTLTSGMIVATAHLVSDDEEHHCDILAKATELMRQEYGIDHATLQVETAGICQRTDW